MSKKNVMESVKKIVREHMRDLATDVKSDPIYQDRNFTSIRVDEVCSQITDHVEVLFTSPEECRF